MIANGAEGEPGSVKDRHVMTTRPAAVLEGLALAAAAVGAREGIVFLKASFDRPAAALEKALAAGAAGGLPVRIARGDDSYVTGEETALLEALEGRRPWPRPEAAAARPAPASTAARRSCRTWRPSPASRAAIARSGGLSAHAKPRSSRCGATCGGRACTRSRWARRWRGSSPSTGAERTGRNRHDLPRRAVGRAPHRRAGGHAARSRCAARGGIRAGDGVAARHRRVRLPAGGGGLAGRVLRARVLRPVPALHGGQRRPRPHAARGGKRRRSRAGAPRPGRGRRLHEGPRVLRALAHRGRAR